MINQSYNVSHLEEIMGKGRAKTNKLVNIVGELPNEPLL